MSWPTWHNSGKPTVNMSSTRTEIHTTTTVVTEQMRMGITVKRERRVLHTLRLNTGHSIQSSNRPVQRISLQKS